MIRTAAAGLLLALPLALAGCSGDGDVDAPDVNVSGGDVDLPSVGVSPGDVDVPSVDVPSVGVDVKTSG